MSASSLPIDSEPEINDLHRLRAALDAAERRAPLRGLGRQLGAPIRFDSWLEQDYLRYRAETSLTLQRLAVALGVLFYSIYLGYDWLGPRRYVSPELLLMLMGPAVPVNTALFFATFMRKPWRWTLRLALLATIANTLGMIMAGIYTVQRGLPIPRELLVVQLLYDFFLLGLPWVQATSVALFAVVVAPPVFYVAGLRGTDLFDFVFFSSVPAALSSIGCYLQERSQRLSWLRAQLLRLLSESDSLTGIYNHRVFYERSTRSLQQAIRERRSVAVLAVDVDHFKAFNDAHGHLAGDECLRHVSHVMHDVARRPLDVVGRIGGEEFAAFFYDTTPAAAMVRAEHLRTAIRGMLLPMDVRVTVSIGLVHAHPDDQTTVESLVGLADSALYAAKNAGRDCVRTA